MREAAKALGEYNRALEQFCQCPDLGPTESYYCSWMAMDDLQYENIVGRLGRSLPVHLPWLDDESLLLESGVDSVTSTKCSGSRCRSSTHSTSTEDIRENRRRSTQ